MASDAHERWLFMRGSNQEKNLFLVGGRLWEVALTKWLHMEVWQQF